MSDDEDKKKAQLALQQQLTELEQMRSMQLAHAILNYSPARQVSARSLLVAGIQGLSTAAGPVAALRSIEDLLIPLRQQVAKMN